MQRTIQTIQSIGFAFHLQLYDYAQQNTMAQPNQIWQVHQYYMTSIHMIIPSDHI